jgi:hypothetical protein
VRSTESEGIARFAYHDPWLTRGYEKKEEDSRRQQKNETRLAGKQAEPVFGVVDLSLTSQ